MLRSKFACLMLGTLAFGGCKSDSKKSTSGRAPTDTSNDIQRQLQQQQGQGNRSLTLGAKNSGETVMVSSANLDSIGGVSVVVTGIKPEQLVVGILAGPDSFTLSNTAGQIRVNGQFPAGVLTGVQLTIVARDTSLCTKAVDCSARPDARGRFTTTQIVPNPSWDVQGQFSLQVQAGSIGTGTGTDPGIGSGSPTPNPGNQNQSFISQLFSNPMSAIKSGANSAWTWIKNLFE
jgi:opacity protein-like surface antigen